MASRAQWRFGIFAIGLQMAIKLNQTIIYGYRSPGCDNGVACETTPPATTRLRVYSLRRVVKNVCQNCWFLVNSILMHGK